MKPTFLTVVAFIGVLAFLVLFLADREMQSGIERLSHYRFSPRSALAADSGLRLVKRRSRSGLAPQADGAVLDQQAPEPQQRAVGSMFRRPTGLKIDWEWQTLAQPRTLVN